jgi:hypothetical protein
MKINKLDLAWAAGIIDGEGSVMLIRSHPNDNECPVVSVTNTSMELLEKMSQMFGGKIRKQKKYNPKHTQAYIWSIKHQHALECIKMLAPMIVIPKKKNRSDLIISTFPKVSKRRYSPEEKQAFKKFVASFKAIP